MKWYGEIGFATTVETEPGVYEETTTSQKYYGELLSDRRKRQNGGEVNDNINVSNMLSVIADPFLLTNTSSIAYVTMLGSKWKVSDVEILYPRIVLSIGGVYNG